MPVLSTLNSSQIAICDRTLRELHFIAPNRGIIAAIVLSNPRLTSRIRAHYRGDYREEGVLESCERELLMDSFALFYTGHYWPVYSDNHDASVEFFDELMERTSETGWVFTD